MEIKIDNGTARLYTPYHPDFVKAVKQIGGAKWDRDRKCWTVPESSVDAAREIMARVYGYNDIEANDTVTLRVRVPEGYSVCLSDVVLYGKVLSHASGRDSGARVGDDVAYVKGGATSCGSMRNWRSAIKAGSEMILHNVNRRIFEGSEPNESFKVELIEEKADKNRLIEEKERLLRRIAEIDKLLDAETARRG